MKTLVIVLFCIVSAGSAFAAPPPLLLQHPTLSRDAIAFDFAGEIWTVPRQDPALVRQGRDPQLEKAVEVALDLLKKNPPVKFKRPPYPDYKQRLPTTR